MDRGRHGRSSRVAGREGRYNLRAVPADLKPVPGALRAGLVRGIATAWFLVKIIVPLSAAVALLDWTGILAAIGRVLSPVMGLFGLPGEAAVALVSGFFAGVYGGVAAAAALPLTPAQVTIVAIIVLTAHNLVVESTVQSRSGTSGLAVTGVRLVTAFLLGAAVWQVIRWEETGPAMVRGAAASACDLPFWTFAAAWAAGAGALILKIFLIVAGLMIVTELMRAYGLFQALERPMRPIMRLMGLSERVTFLWLTAAFLGIAYGAGLIVQEARENGRYQPGDLRDLHVSTGISHSLLEDTLLFVAIGAHPLWILIPRPFAAAAAVRLARPLVPVRPVGGTARGEVGH